MRWWLLLLCAGAAGGSLLGAQHPPTKGALWPSAALQRSQPTYYKYDPATFNVSVVGHTCDVLTRAVERYTFVVRDLQRIARRYHAHDSNSEVRRRRRRRRRRGAADAADAGYLRALHVLLRLPCEDRPYYYMDEAYNLTVSSSISVVSSSSLWGALRGLESWAQLFYIEDEQQELRINETWISDAPRYRHRGLLVDSARHFLSVAALRRTLDAMAMNKLNVLHWHIVDDQSFPYRSRRFPQLSERGAFHRALVYSPEDVRALVSHARDRGIRVLPEFDVPGHTRSWGEAFPGLLTPCYKDGQPAGLGPMHPLRNDTYGLLRDLLAEVTELFPDEYLHVGGDEVDLACWESNPELREYMRAHNMTSARELHALFMSRVLPLLGRRSQPIVWQEVFDEGVSMSNETLIQVWKGGEIFEMMNILRAGYRVIYSSSWYLDQLHSGGDWEAFYNADPRDMLRRYAPDLDEARVVGGEACMWGELVDDTNLISRVWPRASAVAERLWSPAGGPASDDTRARLEEHACRMARRGVRAQPPNGPGYCLGAL